MEIVEPRGAIVASMDVNVEITDPTTCLIVSGFGTIAIVNMDAFPLVSLVDQYIVERMLTIPATKNEQATVWRNIAGVRSSGTKKRSI
jgi:hypothetical protein